MGSQIERRRYTEFTSMMQIWHLSRRNELVLVSVQSRILRWEAGPARSAKFIFLGIPVSLGTEVAGGHSSSILEQVRHAYLSSRNLEYVVTSTERSTSKPSKVPI
jgi:hypothetical protein